MMSFSRWCISGIVPDCKCRRCLESKGLPATEETERAAEERSKIESVTFRKRMMLFSEISRERARQDEEWGGSVHDDSHELFEWFYYITKQIRLAKEEPYEMTSGQINFEERMVKVAALAIAAIESSRRQRPNGVVKSQKE